MVINQRGFNFKKSSIYRQIKEGRLQLKLSNLPRYIPSNVSKEKDKSYKRNIEGHTYEDYIEYVKNNQQGFIVVPKGKAEKRGIKGDPKGFELAHLGECSCY